MDESEKVAFAKELNASFRDALCQVREEAERLNEANRLCGLEAMLEAYCPGATERLRSRT